MALKNYISYWMVLNCLIENDMITDIDEAYMIWYEGNQEFAEDPFFIFDKSLELIFTYFKKLAVFDHKLI